MKEMYIKELRDVVRWVPLGLLFACIMAYSAAPDGIYEAAQFEKNLFFPMSVASSVIAVALGLLQSSFDAKSDARGYLLHRPLDPTTIYWAKIAAGLTGFLISLTPAFLGLAGYSMFKGLDWWPLNGWQVLPSVLLCLATFALHPTMIWMIYRDARWIGTKTLVCVGVATAVILLNFNMKALTYSSEWMLAAGTLLILVATLPVFFAARDAFCRESCLLPATSGVNASFSKRWCLVLSALFFYGFAFGFLSSLLPDSGVKEHTKRLVVMDREGTWWDVAKTRSYLSWHVSRYEKREPGSTAPRQKIDDKDFQLSPSALMTDVNRRDRLIGQFKRWGSFETSEFQDGRIELVEHRGRLLVYGNRGGLKVVMGPAGTASPSEAMPTPFTGFAPISWVLAQMDLSISLLGPALMMSDQGLFQFDPDTLVMRKLSDFRAQRIGLLLPANGQPAQLLAMSDQKLAGFEIVPSSPEEQLLDVDDPSLLKTNSLTFGQINLKPAFEHTFDQLSDVQNKELWISRTASGDLGYTSLQPGRQTYGLLKGGDSKTIPVRGDDVVADSLGMIAFATPPALMGTGLIVAYCFAPDAPVLSDLVTVFLCILMHLIIGAIASRQIAKSRGLTKQQQRRWLIAGSLMGLGTVLAVIAIHRQRTKDQCTACGEITPVEDETCQYCGKPWESPQNAGIEIFDRESQAVPVEMMIG